MPISFHQNKIAVGKDGRGEILNLKRNHPEADVTGLDGDPEILKMAKTKIIRAGLDIKLDLGMSFELPYPDSSFDRAVSSLVFHPATIIKIKSVIIIPDILMITKTSTRAFSHSYYHGRSSGIFQDQNQMLSCIRAHKNK